MCCLPHSHRRANNNKNQSVEERLPQIRRWHARLRVRLQDAPPFKLHPVWGRWLPENRLSVDQVPCNLREGIKATYDEKGATRIWIAGTKADDGKRFCTLQIIARASNGDPSKPRNGQPKIGVIFRGQGIVIRDEEKKGWHPDVHVRFQKKAWADDDYCLAHAGKEMVEATAEARRSGAESVAFYDNLSGQTTKDHETVLRVKACCVRHLLPTGVTSEIQLIDDGVGYSVKREMGMQLDAWLIKEGNLEKWTLPPKEGGLEMWEKRVLITQLAAAAWEKVAATFDFEKAATRIGMRMTIDGSKDDLIQLQGVEGYKFSAEDADLPVGGGRRAAATVGEGDDPDEARANQDELLGEDDGEEEVPTFLDGEDASEVSAAGPLYDSSDEEDDTEKGGGIPPAPDTPPDGFQYVASAPALETDQQKRALVGAWILHAFDTPTFSGWFRGRVFAKGCSAADLRKTPTANYVVTYDRRITKHNSVHGKVATTLLSSNYGPEEWWVLLKKDE